MYNPRNSFISSNTNTTTTYPSTLSPNATLSTPLSPSSPRHPARLHRSSKRNLRNSVSVASLRPITEDVNAGRRSLEVVDEGRGAGGRRRGGVTTPIPTTRPSSTMTINGSETKTASRPSSSNAVPSQATLLGSSRPASARPPSTERTDKLVTKQSTERMRINQPPKPQVATGLGLTLDPLTNVVTQIKPVQAIAQPKRPKPIDVNPKKESMADEWERELIQSARNLDIGLPPQQGGRGKGVNRDTEWERAGSWQAEVDPIREAEDRSRRDAKGEKAFPPERPRAPIRAASNGVTSVHIGVRPRLHPSRANSSMTHNQPDGSLQLPLGSPLTESQAHNYPHQGSIRTGLKFTDEKLQKAQAEYEEWLAKKEEREAGVGHPHDYGTRDWASKGRVPARPAALDAMTAESSTMAQHTMPLQVPRQPPVKVAAPILVHADPDYHQQQPPREPVLVTPVNTLSMPMQDSMLQMPQDPTYLGQPQYPRPGHLSSQPSMDNLHNGYVHGQDPNQVNPYAMPAGMDPMAAWQYQYPYPYDPSFGYTMDPAMYQQYWNPSNSWYGPQYNNNPDQYGQSNTPEGDSERISKVHFQDPEGATHGSTAIGIGVKGTEPYADDQYDPMPQGYDTGAYQQPTPYGGIGFGLGGSQAGGGGGMGMSMMGTPMAGNMMGGGMMGPGGGMGLGGMSSMTRGMASGQPQQSMPMGAMGSMPGMAGMGGMGGMGGMLGMGEMGIGMGQPGNSIMYPQQMGFPMGGGQSMGMGGMGGMMKPYMMQQQQQQQQMTPAQLQGGQAGSLSAGTGQLDSQGNELKPFDSTQMKRGRMGHYGYLEGRELAGPPVGYLPAGMQPTGSTSPSQGRNNISPGTAVSPSQGYVQSQGPGSYFPAGSVAGSGQYAQSGGASGSMWGGSSNMPRARYDGKPGGGHVQADTDTPYPRVEGRGMSTSWTPWQDGAPVDNDYRYSVGHRGRMREGKV